MTDNNQSQINYEQFLDFIIPKTKKRITKKLLTKISKVQEPLVRGKAQKVKYDAVCSLAKLFECEVQVMKKIQKQIVRFHQRSADRQLDLQIAQLFQAVDMRNNGKLTRKQIKGILQTHGRPANAKNELDNFVSESDINAVMRRMDADGDEELSFSDFFAALLPYFIYGELKEKPTRNQ